MLPKATPPGEGFRTPAHSISEKENGASRELSPRVQWRKDSQKEPTAGAGWAAKFPGVYSPRSKGRATEAPALLTGRWSGLLHIPRCGSGSRGEGRSRAKYLASKTAPPPFHTGLYLALAPELFRTPNSGRSSPFGPLQLRRGAGTTLTLLIGSGFQGASQEAQLFQARKTSPADETVLQAEPKSDP